MADHYGRGMKIELQWNLGGGAGGDKHHLSKAAGPLDAHHARWAGVAVATLRARIKRHDACRRHALTHSPARDSRTNGVNDPGAIDPRNERQNGFARALLAGAQAHVEHPIDGGRANGDSDLARTRLRIGDLLVAQDVGRSILMNDNGAHAAPTSARGSQRRLPIRAVIAGAGDLAFTRDRQRGRNRVNTVPHKLWLLGFPAPALRSVPGNDDE
jgi:hypothetical protein